MDTSPIRVLHVDDDPSLLKLTGEFLKREDDRFVIETATNADEGLEILADRPPDCIISDYDMPRQNGIEFLANAREGYSELPFILFTGKGSEEVASDAISNGATDYLQKGSGTGQYELLANRVKNAVKQYRSTRRAANLERTRQLAADINQCLIRATSPNEIETRVCRVISNSEPYVTACIADVDRDTMEIDPRTWAGEAAGYFEELNMVVDEGSPGRHAPGGRAFHDREIAVSQNIPEDDRYATWREAALQRGFRSLAVVPIECEDELYGLLAMFASRPQAFDQTERDLLVRLANDIAHALHSQHLQAELERQNDLFGKAQEIANVGAWEYDVETEEVVWTEEMYRIFETPPEFNLAPDNTLKHYHSEDRSRLRNAFFTAVENAEPYEETVRVQTDSETRWVRTKGDPYTENGHVTKVRGTVHDITEQKTQERRLQELNDRFEHLAEAVPEGLFMIAADYSEVLYVNSAAKELYGIADDDVYDDPTAWQRHVHPKDQDRLQADVEAQLSGDIEGPQHQEFRIKHPERGTRWLNVDMYPIHKNGETNRLAGVATDVTERKEREAELVRYERIVENLDDVATIIAPDGTITYVSPSVRRVLGYDPKELIGENGFGYQPETTAEDVADAIEYVLENPSDPRTIQTKFRQKDGSFCWVESTLRNQVEDEMVGGILVSSRDISERKHRQEQSKRQNERLDEFASAVSHDLRNPLRVADGRLELARAECDSPHLDEVADALDRSQALIEDLLRLARAGKTAGDMEGVSVAALAEECWEMVPGENATLTIETDRTISADWSRLRQLLENLLANAVEHGGEDVTVRVGDLTEGFYVADDGVGIPEGEREDIFEAGHSTADTAGHNDMKIFDSTRGRNCSRDYRRQYEEGTGFGLRITKQIVDAHGWDIRVTDSDNGGARFEITGVEISE